MKKVIVAMSGGVDSSVSTALLKKANFAVTGMYIKCWDASDPMGHNCASTDEERMARLAAAKISIPFYTVDLRKEYKKRVFEYMVEGYRRGITPNPDAMCNKEIKFGLFFEKAMELGADYVATGHYARVRRCACSKTGGSPAPAAGARLRSRRGDFSFAENQAPRASEGFSPKHACLPTLLTGKDSEKDQSYFLAFIRPEILDKVLFPIGDYTKPQVRELARKFGLPNAERKDSQGICFIGKVDFADFLKQYIPSKTGDIVDMAGNVLGKHEGAWYYTIGQRQGLGLSGGPYFVLDKDIQNNIVVVSKNEKDLEKSEVSLANLNWFSDPQEEMRANPGARQCLVKLRYRQTPAAAHIEKNDRGLRLVFESPQRAVTPGQLAILYSGEHVIAGATIQ